MGVRPGCPLRPLLFGIIWASTSALSQLAVHTLPPVLFPNDLFLLSSSACLADLPPSRVVSVCGGVTRAFHGPSTHQDGAKRRQAAGRLCA